MVVMFSIQPVRCPQQRTPRSFLVKRLGAVELAVTRCQSLSLAPLETADRPVYLVQVVAQLAEWVTTVRMDQTLQQINHRLAVAEEAEVPVPVREVRQAMGVTEVFMEVAEEAAEQALLRVQVVTAPMVSWLSSLTE